MIKIKIWAWIDGKDIEEDVSAYFVILYYRKLPKKPRLGQPTTQLKVELLFMRVLPSAAVV
jgi:hypothetical protein